jgi:hypothetical protein
MMAEQVKGSLIEGLTCGQSIAGVVMSAEAWQAAAKVAETILGPNLPCADQAGVEWRAWPFNNG